MDADRAQITDLAEDEDDYPHLETTRVIIGAAYEVHGELGPGFLEKVYEAALAQELTSRNVPVRAQAEITVPLASRSAFCSTSARNGFRSNALHEQNENICEKSALICG